MALSKLETQIKEQLNAREIKPTEMAWDRLDAMLSVAEEKKSKKGFGWMSIAAVFIGLLMAGFIFFQLNSNEIPVENSVVNQDNTTNPVETNPGIQKEIVQPNTSDATSTTSLQIAESKSSKQTKSIINQKTCQKPIVTVTENFQNKGVVAHISIEEEINIEPNIKIVPITVNPELLLASVESSKKEKSSKSSVNVTAESMLAQAEGTKKQNFRESAFQKLKRNFKTVKTAVENRNIQE